MIEGWLVGMTGTVRRTSDSCGGRAQAADLSPGQTSGMTSERGRASKPAGGRRRLAIASFHASRDGRIYTRLALDATPILDYIETTRVRTGVQVTITHVVAAALARAIREVPEARTRVVLGRALPLDDAAISFTVDVEGGADLVPIRVDSADEKTPVEIAELVRPAVAKARQQQDRPHHRSTWWVRRVPWWGLRPALQVAGFVFSGLGRPAFGQAAFPLGAALVSNVGPLGLDEAFLAPMPMARVPLYLAVGAVRDAPMVVAGELAVRPQVVLVATGDHRLIDGAHAGKVVVILRELLTDPTQLDVPWSRRR
jgi:pyruvate/2-oxoglutarate dehydrogenase complex dihydrolipoamide acyltransferase (E2) component